MERSLVFSMLIYLFLCEDDFEALFPLGILSFFLLSLQKVMERVLHFYSLIGNEPHSIVFEKQPKNVALIFKEACVKNFFPCHHVM